MKRPGEKNHREAAEADQSPADMGMIIKNDYDLILIIVWNIFWLWLDYDYLVFVFFDYDLIMITLVLAVLIMIRFFLFVRDYD